MDIFMKAAIEEARQGLAEGGIPIGSVLVHNGVILVLPALVMPPAQTF